MDRGPDPAPYLWLMDRDRDPGGPKICGSCGSGSPTLVLTLVKKTLFGALAPVQGGGEGFASGCNGCKFFRSIFRYDSILMYISGASLLNHYEFHLDEVVQVLIVKREKVY
jgi:hypothetical protein